MWSEYIAGEPRRLARFRELLDPLTQKTRDLGNAPLLQLLLAINAAPPQLPDPYPLDGQVMSLEMASALLMVENIIHHFNNLPSDLDQQVAIMKNWLATAIEGKVATSSPPGLRADIVQQPNDEKLRIITAREILKSLQQVERAVDAYANDPAQRIGLEPQASVLRQVRGVFEISSQKRAARLATACQHWVERCLTASTTACGWELEQVLNHWLAQGHSATPELLALADDTRVLLAEWAHALQGEAAPAIDARHIASRARALRGESAKVTAAAAPPTLGTHTMPQLRRSAKSAPPRPEVSVIEGTATRIIPPPPAPPALEQTLADLGERLAWMHGLVEEIQQQATAADNTGAFATTRVTEIAQMKGESVSEALALQRALSEQLAPKK